MDNDYVDVMFDASDPAVIRFRELADSMGLTDDQLMSYLLDLHDKLSPENKSKNSP